MFLIGCFGLRWKVWGMVRSRLDLGVFDERVEVDGMLGTYTEGLLHQRDLVGVN